MNQEIDPSPDRAKLGVMSSLVLNIMEPHVLSIL